MSKYCIDCNKDTFVGDEDYYMFSFEVWKSITKEDGGNYMLCWHCAEIRLGRKIINSDLMLCPRAIMNPNSRALLTQSQIYDIMVQVCGKIHVNCDDTI